MKLNNINNQNQDSHQVVYHFDFSHATINIGSNNTVSTNEEVKVTQSLEQGSAKDKSQSHDWRKTFEIILVILRVLTQLLIIAPPLFHLLC